MKLKDYEYYRTELGVLYKGDCLEILPLIDEFDICLTSPPYNANHIGWEKGRNKYGGAGKDKMKYENYEKFIFDILDLIIPKTKYYTFFNIARNFGNKKICYKIIARYIQELKDIFIWGKSNPVPCNLNTSKGIMPNVGNAYEFIYCFSIFDNINRTFKRHNIKRNIYNHFYKSVNQDTDKDHKALFPKWLPYFYINNFVLPDDIVIDPFFGLGRTAVPCERLNRRWIGIEISEKYCEIAKQRIKAEVDQMKLKLKEKP